MCGSVLKPVMETVRFCKECSAETQAKFTAAQHRRRDLRKPPSECCGYIQRRRGRPVQIDQSTRQDMVLDAVRELLCQCRLEDVSMAAIARRAGMSKRTLYTLFSSREELLGAAFARIGGTIFRPLDAGDRALPLPDRLRQLLTVNLSPEFEHAPLELMRAVIAEAPVYPGIAREFDANGRGALIRYISAELDAALAEGEVACHDMTPDEAAELLVDMVMGNALHALMTSGGEHVSPEQKAVRRDRSISIFLDGLRPR